MKKSPFKLSLFMLGASLLCTGTAQAEISYRGSNNYLDGSRTSYSIGTGLRQNEFDWNIASDTTGTATPNILSELTWSDIVVFEVSGKLVHVQRANYGILKGNLLLEAEVVGGRTVTGDNQDSDYNGDNRTLEFSRSNNNANRGYSYGGEIATGYEFNLAQKKRPGSHTLFKMGPIIGYGFHRQEYVITEGNQTIPALGVFTGLDSKYIADWYGPFAGLQTSLEHNRHLFTFRGEYHDLTYDAEAQWNLRADFKQDPSYTHEADDASGIELNAGYSYALDSFTDITLDYTYLDRKAENGTDTTFFVNDTVISTRLNEVNDTSHALRLGLTRLW